MKDAKEESKKPETVSNDEIWAWVMVMLLVCITIVFTTRMHVDASLVGDMIQHYTLRGKDVIVKDDHLVFVN